MSALEDYKEAYNQFVTLLTDLHNANVVYTKQLSFRNGVTLRKVLRQMRIVEKNLWTASVAASREASKMRGRGRLKKEK